MADARYRRLQRAAARGEPHAQAQLLREQVRLGALDPERLQLAAWLGDSPARIALGEHRPYRVERLEPWVHGFGSWESAVSVRAAVVLAAAEPGTPLRALRAARRWMATQAAEAGPSAW